MFADREIVDTAIDTAIDVMAVDTAVGAMVAAVSVRGLMVAGIAGETVSAESMSEEIISELSARHPRAVINRLDDDAATQAHARVVTALVALAAGAEPDELPPVHLVGTEFQIRVWEQLRRIRRGQVCSYGEVAAAIGAPSAVRATAGAVGANPVGLIVPCHRVIRSDGTIGGFGWGIETKRRLLAAEGVHLVDDPGTVR